MKVINNVTLTITNIVPGSRVYIADANDPTKVYYNDEVTHLNFEEWYNTQDQWPRPEELRAGVITTVPQGEEVLVRVRKGTGPPYYKPMSWNVSSNEPMEIHCFQVRDD